MAFTNSANEFNELQVRRSLQTLASPDIDASDTPENPSFWWKLVHLNPALLRGLVIALFAVLAGVGLIVSDQMQNSIIAFIGALFALIQALWTHGAVTANAKVVAYKPDPVAKPSVVAAGDAISTDVVAVANAAATAPVTSNVQPLLPFPSALKR